MLKAAIAIIIALIVVPLAVVLIRFNRKRLHIIRCSEAATIQQLEAVYAQIDRLGTEVPTCAVLARMNQISGAEKDWIVPLPPCVGPWNGRAVSADLGSEVAFHFSSTTASEPVLRGRAYRIVPVPRHLTNSGKARNQFSPAKYVTKNLPLLTALTDICPKYPAELLSYLLAAGAETFEFDPVFQVRVGGSPSWVQSAEFPNCDECKERMDMILQIPGALLPGKALPDGTFYFFGCARHPENTKTVSQFS